LRLEFHIDETSENLWVIKESAPPSQDPDAEQTDTDTDPTPPDQRPRRIRS